MNRWLRRARAALVMGATWALAWGLVGGFIMEAIVDPRGEIVDMWPQTLAIPGFLGGALFSVLLWARDRRRKFEELSLRHFGALGAATGVLLGGLVVSALGGVGALLTLKGAIVVGATTLLSTASASGSLALARSGKERLPIEASRHADDARITNGDHEKRLPLR